MSQGFGASARSGYNVEAQSDIFFGLTRQVAKRVKPTVMARARIKSRVDRPAKRQRQESGCPAQGSSWPGMTARVAESKAWYEGSILDHATSSISTLIIQRIPTYSYWGLSR